MEFVFFGIIGLVVFFGVACYIGKPEWAVDLVENALSKFG